MSGFPSLQAAASSAGVICGPELKDILYDEVVVFLGLNWSEGTHDKKHHLLLALISMHASSNSTYDGKFQAIVNDFLCDGTDIIADVPPAVEESPEIVFNAGDSVIFVGEARRFNGKQLITGTQGHVVREEDDGFIKAEFEGVGRAVVVKEQLWPDGGDKLLSLTAANLANHAMQRSGGSPRILPLRHRKMARPCCVSCLKKDDDSEMTEQGLGTVISLRQQVCAQCEALANKCYEDVEIARKGPGVEYVKLTFTLQHFKEGQYSEHVRIVDIEKNIADRKRTKAYKRAVAEKNHVKAPSCRAVREVLRDAGSEASSSHSYPQGSGTRHNPAMSADTDPNWRIHQQDAWQFQQLQYAQALHFWTHPMHTMPFGQNYKEMTHMQGSGSLWVGHNPMDNSEASNSSATGQDVAIGIRQSQVITNVRDTESEPQEIPLHGEVELGSTECVICLDKPKSHAIIPCGHRCVCQLCAVSLAGGFCPICRGHVREVIKIFSS